MAAKKTQHRVFCNSACTANQTNILLYCKKYMTRKTLEFFQPRKRKCNLPSTGFDPGKYFILNKCQKNLEKKPFRSKINCSISDNYFNVLKIK